MVRIGFAITFMLFVNVISAEDSRLVQCAMPAGKWRVDSVEMGGEMFKSGIQDEWEFAGDQVTRIVDGENKEVAKVELRRNRNSMEIDFIPIEENMKSAYILFPVRTKGLFLIKKDELKLAMTFGGSPGPTAEEERRRAIPAKGIRPADFDTKRGDVWVLTFKRKN